jgi:hypothetical protein
MLIALASAGEHGTYKAGSVSDFPVCLEREIVIALVGQRSKRGMAWFRQIKIQQPSLVGAIPLSDWS